MKGTVEESRAHGTPEKFSEEEAFSMEWYITEEMLGPTTHGKNWVMSHHSFDGFLLFNQFF
jgi:hypothetical protein